jgi:hypothetical protein
MILGYRPIYDFTAAPDLASPLASLIDAFGIWDFGLLPDL